MPKVDRSIQWRGFSSCLPGQGRSVGLIRTQSKTAQVLIRILETKLSAWHGTFSGRLTVEGSKEYKQLARQLAQVRVVVTSSSDCVVFSFRHGIPVPAERNIRRPMKVFRQGSSCLEIAQVTLEDLKRKFFELDEPGSLRSSEIQENTRSRDQLDDQYQGLLKP